MPRQVREQAAEYLRMSTDKQCYSIASQREAIRAYAEREGLEVVRSYVDEARSGVTMKRRDGLKSLLSDVMAGAPFSTVLVLDVSRWGRFQDPDQAAHYEFLCREAGVSVQYCAEPFENDGSATSSLVKNLKRVMAAEYSRNLSDRCRAGLRRQVLAGAWGGGVAPYAWARQTFDAEGRPGRILGHGDRRGANQVVRLVHGPREEIENVRTVFRLFTTGIMGPARIASHLNASGVSYRGGSWTDQRVRKILKNEMARGIFTFNRSSARLGKVTFHEPDQWQKMKIAGPMISLATWRAAQAKFEALDGERWTDDELVELLRRLLAREGFISRWLVRQSRDVPCESVYIRRFGSVDAACARIPYVRPRAYRQHVDPDGLKREVIIERLKELLEEKGYLSLPDVRASTRLPSLNVIYREFGSLTRAYAAAGYHRSRGDLVRDGRARAARRDGSREGGPPAV